MLMPNDKNPPWSSKKEIISFTQFGSFRAYPISKQKLGSFDSSMATIDGGN